MASIIPSDTLSGLPATGTHMGGFMKNTSKGVGTTIITLGAASAVADTMKLMPKALKKHSIPKTKIPSTKMPKLPKHPKLKKLK